MQIEEASLPSEKLGKRKAGDYERALSAAPYEL